MTLSHEQGYSINASVLMTTDHHCACMQGFGAVNGIGAMSQWVACAASNVNPFVCVSGVCIRTALKMLLASALRPAIPATFAQLVAAVQTGMLSLLASQCQALCCIPAAAAACLASA